MTMLLRLVRRPTRRGATLGELFIDGAHECFTLEDQVRRPGVKYPGDTAIPAGRYQVAVTHSPRFGRDMPLLLDVPGFEGIRIHWGNWARDTEGCILTGQTEGDAFIGHSMAAFNELFPKLQAACAAGPVFIEIISAQDEPPAA